MLSLAMSALSCGDASDGGGEPRLIVVAVVDQLRPDLLTRYASTYTGGLRRILDQGYHFANAMHDHAVTNTAPGHATLSTGKLPSQHGIVDNSWYERVGDRFVGVAAVADTTMEILGKPDLRGASPHKMEASTLAEWLQARYRNARVVSVGGKDRSAVFMVGRARAHVYWFSRDAGRFVTSSWYGDREPDWARRFHEDVWPGFSADSVWVQTTPAEFRALARADDAPFETARESTFPHVFEPSDRNAEERARAYWNWFYGNPRLDAATLQLATAALRAEQLGQDNTPDLLAIALSATDVIGHDFGPLSQEQLDNLLHLDRVLGEFFDVLDTEVGADNWLLALSADHGVGTMPEQLERDGVPARRVPHTDIEALFADLDAAVRVYEETGVLSSVAELERILAVRTAVTPWIAAAMPRIELAYAAATDAWRRRSSVSGAGSQASLITSPSDTFVQLYRNSFYKNRMMGGPLWSREKRRSIGTYGVEVRLEENTNVHRSDAVHGSPYRYDRHVPLFFLGHGISAGTSDAAVRTVDLAPTLASVLGLEVPEDVAGEVLHLQPD